MHEFVDVLVQVACRNLRDSTDYSLQQSIVNEYVLVFSLKLYLYRVGLIKSVSSSGSLAVVDLSRLSEL